MKQQESLRELTDAQTYHEIDLITANYCYLLYWTYLHYGHQTFTKHYLTTVVVSVTTGMG